MPRSIESSPGSEKSKKYDRQLRLWGDHGQSAIEGARVAVINAGPTGTEILKNLVLPGVGSFTIIDSHTVTNEDIGCNFFLSSSSVGSNRGKETVKYLLELNPDVRGDHLEDSLEEILDKNSKIFTSFTLVILTDIVKEESLLRLSSLLYSKNIPLIVTRINGLFAYTRLQVKEHVIIESKPDSVLEDLRLDAPFPSLLEYFESFRQERSSPWNSMKRQEVTHVPFVSIIYLALLNWREEMGKGSQDIPLNYKEKEQLRLIIRSWVDELKRKKWSDEGDSHELDLTNFDEAQKAVNSVLVRSSQIPSGTQKVIDMLDDGLHNPKNTRFWTLVRGLKEFISQYNCLPVRGSIPDMTSDSKSYVTLQQIYSAKAKEDADILGSILSSFSDGVDFSDNELRTFCRNAHCLQVIRTPSLEEEYAKKSDAIGDEKLKCIKKVKDLISTEDMSNDNDSVISQYLMFRAIDRFYSRFSRIPGHFEDQTDEDVVHLKSCLKNVLSDIGVSPSGGSRDDLIQAFVSFGGSQVHAASSFIGGIVSQEVIKLLTSQFVPIDHTLIYNAIASSVGTLTF